MSAVGGFKRRTAKTKTTQRAIKKYEPKVVENAKRVLFLKGASANEVVVNAMNDLAAITKPYCKKLKKRNAFLPFEGREHLEFLGFKNDCSLFCFAAHNKKRPNNLTLGRHFDFHVLDMVELGIVAADRLDMTRIHDIDAANLGGKPFFVFEGSEFSTEPAFVRLKNLLVDFFRGGQDPVVSLDGCDRVLFFSLRSRDGSEACVAPSTDCYGSKPPAERGNTVLCMRHYAVQKPSTAAEVTASIKNINLYDIGPNFDLELRRISFATPQEFKLACRLPRATLATLRATAANLSTDPMHNLKGQLHVGKQDVAGLNLRRFKAHRGRAESGTEPQAELSEQTRNDEAAATLSSDAGAVEESEQPHRARRHKRRRTAEEMEETAGRPETDI